MNLQNNPPKYLLPILRFSHLCQTCHIYVIPLFPFFWGCKRRKKHSSTQMKQQIKCLVLILLEQQSCNFHIVVKLLMLLSAYSYVPPDRVIRGRGCPVAEKKKRLKLNILLDNTLCSLLCGNTTSVFFNFFCIVNISCLARNQTYRTASDLCCILFAHASWRYLCYFTCDYCFAHAAFSCILIQFSEPTLFPFWKGLIVHKQVYETQYARWTSNHEFIIGGHRKWQATTFSWL